ncbi:MAG: type III-A CRISPR-associated RAMP protein Csm5 [Nitrospirota bacterium]
MNRPIRIRLEVLSPINIGCDDVYEPTRFVIDEERKRLIEFDPVDFYLSLDDRAKDRFSDICMGDNILSIFKFIKSKYKDEMGGNEVEVSDGLIQHYKKVLGLSAFNKKEVINNFTLNKTAYNPFTREPYIPGSSLKGSVRTAYLNKLAKEKGVKDIWNQYLHPKGLDSGKEQYYSIGKKRVANRLEKDKLLLGAFESDPFRLVKISDLFPVGEVKTRIVYAVNRKKRPSDRDASGPYQLLESINKGFIFQGTINVETPLTSEIIKSPITIESLIDAIGNFYRDIWNEDKKIFEDIGINFNLDGSNLIRIGRHSGVEAVTIEGNRYIKIMQGKGNSPKYLDHATTLWLASSASKPNSNQNLLPFGWAKISVISEDEYEKDLKEREEKQITLYKKEEALRQKQMQEKRKIEEKKREQEEQQRKREEEERLAKEEWDRLSEEDKMIKRISQSNVAESQVMEIYNRLDSITDANKRIEVASALRDYFIRHNKWEKKDISKKQRIKVQNIKRILGEC